MIRLQPQALLKSLKVHTKPGTKLKWRKRYLFDFKWGSLKGFSIAPVIDIVFFILKQYLLVIRDWNLWNWEAFVGTFGPKLDPQP